MGDAVTLNVAADDVYMFSNRTLMPQRLHSAL
jgi:hypothetical protein